ncbi:lymphocyte antigen 6G-like [Poecilia latipinna]|uniref:lymphocyte antigen 6G-like n=1 Tax=Poecilia latipinna TaxID=48699 RepID=UPI00072DB104|nr:PREDICTED: lymphocyte antigen 6G-like [Poecilia latipinna]
MSLLQLTDQAERRLKFKMKLYGALIFFLTVSAACGLLCYTCINVKPESCTSIETCDSGIKNCFSVKLPIVNTVTKGCKISELPCNGLTTCCEGNLCNGAVPTGPGVFLLLMSSGLVMLFI